MGPGSLGLLGYSSQARIGFLREIAPPRYRSKASSFAPPLPFKVDNLGSPQNPVIGAPGYRVFRLPPAAALGPASPRRDGL
jgi:hypothetical protein